MKIESVSLEHFRTYSHSTFSFSNCTVIVGRNAIGKTNILEAMHFLSHGESFRVEKDVDAIEEGNSFAKVKGRVLSDDNSVVNLELILQNHDGRIGKKYLVNGVARRQVDFISNFATVLFTPADIELLTHSPSLRRRYLDSILLQSDRKYRISMRTYEKALKQRNRLLKAIKEERREFAEDEFAYWNSLLIQHGGVIHTSRKELILSLNEADKSMFAFQIIYDHSTFTPERVRHYQEIECKTGMTLIGPQRDDIVFLTSEKRPIATFCSRGEQRLTLLQLKQLEISYLDYHLAQKPVLLLDDIFSELDSENIEKVGLLKGFQLIITTTHRELIPPSISFSSLIEL